MKDYESNYYDEDSSEEYEVYSEGDEFYEDEEDLEGGAYSDGYEYEDGDVYYEDEEDVEGGAYQLDYIDGMYGNGMRGGVIYGGFAKGKVMPLKAYQEMMKRRGYKPSEIKKMRAKLLARRKNPSKKTTKRKASVKRRIPVRGTNVNRTQYRPRPSGKKCKANGTTYRYKSNYDRYCPKKNVIYSHVGKCPSGYRYCPITGRCRLAKNIISCYDQMNQPYFINEKGNPTTFRKDGMFNPNPDMSDYDNVIGKKVYRRGELYNP